MGGNDGQRRKMSNGKGAQAVFELLALLVGRILTCFFCAWAEWSGTEAETKTARHPPVEHCTAILHNVLGCGGGGGTLYLSAPN